jgi:hypothetical protein
MFRAALCKFAQSVAVGLDESDAETRRTTAWLAQEQQDYWKRQLARRTELCTRARSAVVQKRTQVTALGGKPSAVDEEKALAAAERALEEARGKQISVRRWMRVLDQEGYSYQAVAQGLRIALQTDVPRALAQLDQMVAALEAYTAAPVPDEQRSVAEPTGGPLPATEPPHAMARPPPVEPEAKEPDAPAPGPPPASGAGAVT